MSTKVLCFSVLVLFVAYTNCQGNALCPCDPKDNAEEKKMLNLLLEKLSGNVEEGDEQLYSVYPGLLNEFSCDCAEKQRQKRKILPEPEDREGKEVGTEEGTDPEVMKRSVHRIDRRCPEGTYRFARRCVKAEQFDDY